MLYRIPKIASGDFAIVLTTNPSLPKSGSMEVIFKVTDSSGQPVTGADFDVIADHTDIRGMTMHGKASEQTAGQYAINADFSMAGKWKLPGQVQKADLNWKQEINLDIK
ncbi:MAG TPA: FixH family protein [Anaerolineales bacterium]|nr:FixH family protein [Anaerolineales bacterium]